MTSWIFWALIAAIGFGVQTVLFRLVIDKGISATLVTAMVFSLASITVWAYVLLSEKIILPFKNFTLFILIVASIITGLANISAFKALSTVPNPGYSSAITSTSILLITVVSLFVFNLRIDLIGLSGVIFIFLGIILLSGIIKV